MLWEDVLDDKHPYQGVPHTAGIIQTLRTIGDSRKPFFLSEYGIGSAVDLLRVVRLYEQAGKADALCDGFAPLRWCLFAEPVHVYRGTPVRLEACLANEDVLPPGQYPVRLQVVGPDTTRVW